jgi:hypothetical protein
VERSALSGAGFFPKFDNKLPGMVYSPHESKLMAAGGKMTCVKKNLLYASLLLEKSNYLSINVPAEAGKDRVKSRMQTGNLHSPRFR